MTFQEAKQKLSKIADGAFHTIAYEAKKHSTEPEYIPECTLYLDGFNHAHGSTFEEAFKVLNKAIEGKKQYDESQEPV